MQRLKEEAYSIQLALQDRLRRAFDDQVPINDRHENKEAEESCAVDVDIRSFERALIDSYETGKRVVRVCASCLRHELAV